MTVDETSCGASSKLSIRSECSSRSVAGARGDAEARQLGAHARAPSRSRSRRAGRRRSGRPGRHRRRASSWSTVKACGSSSTVASRPEKASRAIASRCSAGACERLVSRGRDHRHAQVVDREVLHCRLGERDVTDVRRVEAAAEDPRHCHSNASSPISTSCPLRTPAAFSAASSSSPCGASPDDAEAAVGAVDPVAAARRRLRPVEPELRQLGLVRLGAPAARASKSERFRCSIPSPVDSGDGEGADDPGVVEPKLRRRREQVDLVENDGLRPLLEAGAVERRARGRSCGSAPRRPRRTRRSRGAAAAPARGARGTRARARRPRSRPRSAPGRRRRSAARRRATRPCRAPARAS